MKSILTDLAKQQIRQTAKYIRKEFGKKRRDEFMQEVRQTRVLIEKVTGGQARCEVLNV
jgi:plasmid stabilization system protein ParE